MLPQCFIKPHLGCCAAASAASACVSELPPTTTGLGLVGGTNAFL